jgi:NAD(P)-dependent dehydrogenase (short-subunit alcohol dehydrogenase family)
VVGCDLASAAFPRDCQETHAFDLLDAPAIAGVAKAILANGVPSVVVLNAGWTNAATLASLSGQDLDGELTGNFTTSAHLCLALLPAMRKLDGDKSFVFTSSVNALTHFGNPAYSAAKAAGMAWMRALAAEEGKHRVRANAVIPASTRTHAWDQRLADDPGILDRLSRHYPLGRIVTPSEVANAVLFLASPLASGITGTSITVDAGLTASNLPFLDAITGVSD